MVFLLGKFLPSLLRTMRTITVVTSLYSSGPLVTNPSQAADMNNVAVPSIPNSLGMYPIHCDGIVVNPLERIGAGGSGTVYRSVVIDSESPTLRPKDSVVVKVSNPGTDNRLENECSILRHLTSLDAPGFERCEAICFLGSYEEPRAALVLTPYFTSDSIVVGSLDSLIEKEGSQESKTSLKTVINRAWQNLVSSCVSALAAGVASSDFQYLVDMQGRTLVLDLTEARILQFASQNKVDDRQFNRELELEQQLVRSFIGELRSNMPSVLGDDGEVYLNTLLIDKLSTKPFFQFLFVEK